MKIMILGAAGFLGTNLTINLAKDNSNKITLVDKNKLNFDIIKKFNFQNIVLKDSLFGLETNFEELISSQDIIYHLVSTTIPSTSNQQIPLELQSNVVATARLLDACVHQKVKKVIFISSGGTIYGKEEKCPLKETLAAYPISSYGLQKSTIEKLLYLYNYIYGLDYRIIRLSNPYGPYQKPNGVLGAVTTFIYKALKHEKIVVYGDGSIVRDFIFVDDFINALLKIVNGNSKYKLFNVGSGKGTSINSLLKIISCALNLSVNIEYKAGRKTDVPINFLDISRYEESYGKLNNFSLKEGILKTAKFIKEFYNI